MSELQTDSERIEAINKGSQKTFRAIYDEHYKLLLGTAINLTKDLDTAKEVVQEVFFQFWKNKESLKKDISIRNYLKRAVINRSINHIKYQSKFNDASLLDDKVSANQQPDEIMVATELRDVLEGAIASLPEKARLIFILKRQEGLSLKEIAAQLEISPKTVENQITRAVKLLKHKIEPYCKKNNLI